MRTKLVLALVVLAVATVDSQNEPPSKALMVCRL